MNHKMFLINVFLLLTLFSTRSTSRVHPTKRSPINTTSTTTTTTLSSNTSFKYKNLSLDQLPKETDWVKEGRVTSIKNQYECGSCWAFAAVAAVEGLGALVTGELRELSEQQILDCNKALAPKGCSGSHTTTAFQYITEYGLAESERYGPYRGTDQLECETSRTSYKGATITGYQRVPNNEMDLMRVVSHQPVTAIIDVCFEFLHFKGGYIFNDSQMKCVPDPTIGKHAVAIVGYGTDDRGVDYWIIKNSHGTGWGDEGYMKLLRNAGICGIANDCYFPTDEWTL